MVLRQHLAVALPTGADSMLCLCDLRQTYDGPIQHRLHVAAMLREAGMVQIPAWAEREGAEWRLVPTGSLEAILALPQREWSEDDADSPEARSARAYNHALATVWALLPPTSNAPEKRP